jgi:heterodisulfide reductase subunit D
MKSEELLRELYHCLHCHLCNFADWHALDEWLPLCPTYAYFGFESFSASGKMELARALLSGELKPSPRTLQILFSDLGCGACHQQCRGLTGLKVEHVELFEELKARLVERGYGPLPEQRAYAESVRKNHNPYRERHEERTSWLERELPERAETVYFVGCTSSYRQREIARSTAEVLLRSGVEFTVLEDEWCCGSPLLRTGQRKLAREVAEHNLEALRRAGARRVVFSCAGCYRTFSKDYPRLLGREPGLELLHTSQYFLRILSGRGLKGNGGRVTYHDPCHLGRGMGVYDPPRELLRRMYGEGFVEMRRSRENSWCCGAGSGVKAAFPDFALWSAARRLEEAEGVEAEVLVSTCPFCKRNLGDASRKRGGMEVRDLSELLEGALT